MSLVISPTLAEVDPDSSGLEPHPSIRTAQEKLNRIIVAPNFGATNLKSALSNLRRLAKSSDHDEPDPNWKGVNLVIKSECVGNRSIPDQTGAKRPLKEVLQELAKTSRTKIHLTPFGVLFADESDLPMPVQLLSKRAPQEQIRITKKLESIIIPTLDLEDKTLIQAIDLVRSLSVELDREPQIEMRGLSFAVDGEDLKKRTIHELKLQNVTVDEACLAIAILTGVKYDLNNGVVQFSGSRS